VAQRQVGNSRFALFLVPLAALSCSISAVAVAEVFNVTATLDGQTRTASFSTVEQAIDVFNDAGLQQLVNAYDGTQMVNVQLDFRGVPIVAQYSTAGSPTLTFSIPSLNVNQTFTGATRDASQELLKDFLQENSSGILNQLGKELARVSPADPLAGNPNSLMSNLVGQDFAAGTGGFAMSMREPSVGGADRSNLAGFGLRFGQYSQGGEVNRSLTLPLSYTIRSDADPRRQFSINMPLTYGTVGTSKSYALGLGTAYRLPVSDRWTLTPALNTAAVGSIDLGTAAVVASGSLTSSYVVPVGKHDVSVGNMVGYYRSLAITVGDYSYDPGVRNTVTRNGLLFSQDFAFFGTPRRLEYSIVDTQFFGTELYTERYDEISIALASSASAIGSKRYWRFGGKYLYSDKIRGFSFTMGTWF